MKALILRNDAEAAVATARALIDKGFQILSVDTQAVAHALIRVDTIDLLVMDELVEGQLTHAIALSGERKNPYLSAIFLTDRTQEETDDLYDLIPCLYALVGADTAPALLGKLALSSVSSIEEVVARVAQNQEQDLAEADDPQEMALLLTDPIGVDTPQVEEVCFSHADIAIAEPALAELEIMEDANTLQSIEEALRVELAAIFRDRPLPQLPLMPAHRGAMAF